MNTYGYVIANPLIHIDPFGLVCATCRANATGGSGYKNGTKQCTYTCWTDDDRKGELRGPAKEQGGNDTCYGVEDKWNYTDRGRTHRPGEIRSFDIDTESLWDKWIYPKELRDSIEGAFP